MMTRIALAAVLATSFTASAMAQSASTDAGVWQGGAGGNATADGFWQHAQSESKVGKVNMGRGFAVGLGPNGLSLSHSIAVGKGPLAVGHNLNMTIGQNGTHVSEGGVVSTGGQTSANVGGSTQGGLNLGGGSNASGNGWNTNAWSNSQTNRRYQSFGQPVQQNVMQQNVVQPVYRSAVMPVNQSRRYRVGSPAVMPFQHQNSQHRHHRVIHYHN